MPATVVEAQDLTIEYGDVVAVKGVSFTGEEGQVLGFLGGNGAGKSSTLKAVSGVNPLTSGTITVSGFSMGDAAGAERARELIGYTPDVGGLIRQATVREHLQLALSCRGRQQEMKYALKLVEEFGLRHVLDRETAGFSHGMSRRLSVLLAALTATRLLALDEPFDGVDPLGVEATMRVIQRAKANGLAVLVSTHLLPLLVQASDDIAVMRDGHIVETAPAATYAGGAGSQYYESLLRSEDAHL